MHNIFYQKEGRIVEIISPWGGGVNSPDNHLMPIAMWNCTLNRLNIWLTTDQSDCSILSRDHKFI